MKTEIFSKAIKERHRIRFFYGFDNVIIDPLYLITERDGRKVIYGNDITKRKIVRFEYRKIANIKVLDSERFTPIIPLFPTMN